MVLQGGIYGRGTYGTSRYGIAEAVVIETITISDGVIYSSDITFNANMSETVTISDNLRSLFYAYNPENMPQFIDGNVYGSDVPVIKALDNTVDTPTILSVHNADIEGFVVISNNDVPILKGVGTSDIPVFKSSHIR